MQMIDRRVVLPKHLDEKTYQKVSIIVGVTSGETEKSLFVHCHPLP